jgi:AAA15 family ATPase/GTPase
MQGQYKTKQGGKSAPEPTGVEHQRVQSLTICPEVRLLDPLQIHTDRPLHELYSETSHRSLRKQAKAIITDLVPGLEDIEIQTYSSHNNQPVLYLNYSDFSHPADLAGDGIRLLLRMTFHLAALPGAAVLLEEPETHMHPGAIRQVATAIFGAVRRGVQVILTTHSLELVDALLETSTESELDLMSIYRLRLKDGMLESHRRTGREAAIVRSEIQEDLR